VRIRLFWKLGLAYSFLILAVLLVVDIYFARALRRDYVRAGFDQLQSLMRLVEQRPPRFDDTAALAEWADWMSRTGARATVIAVGGTVLADSHEDPRRMENHAARPEIREALLNGQGQAVRYSSTVRREMADLAVRFSGPNGAPVIVRLGLPLQEIDAALAEIRREIGLVSLVILLLAGGASLLFTRSFSERIEQLKQFAERVSEGDFRPLPEEIRQRDELSELRHRMNETAARLDETVRTLTDERNRSAAVLSSMAEGVAVVGADERVVFCNHAFCQVIAMGPEQCHGRPVVEVAREPILLAAVRQVLGGTGDVRSELAVGTLRPKSYAVTAAPVRAELAKNGIAGAVLVLHDITELRHLERVRRDFVANVSHELKTPLTAIQGFAETLLSGALEDAKNNRRFLEIIRDHAGRMSALTSDLLKLSQIEAGKMEMDFRPTKLADLIDGCVETVRLRAEQKQLSLRVECPADLPAVRGDARHLRDVLENLLNNAVQYTPAGGSITVSAAVRKDRDVPSVRVTVADTGIGIPEAHHPRVFERFYRVDPARSRELGGTGLGLSIVKHLVEAHGGRVEAVSALGQGTTIRILLPTGDVPTT
jgi:two-component system phosphate regulon sensor histidine kinase PhoR